MKTMACFTFHLFLLSQKMCLLSLIYYFTNLIQLKFIFHICSAFLKTICGLFSLFGSNTLLHLQTKIYHISKAASHTLAFSNSIPLVSFTKTLLR